MRGVPLFLAIFVVACGGQVDDDGRGTSGGSGGSTAKADGGNGLPTSPLPPCVPGKPPAEHPTCPYLASGLCYDDKISACACECRKTKGTVCVSGFPGYQVEVACG